MNSNETQVNEFIQKVQDVLDKKEKAAFIEFEGHPDELKQHMEQAFGDKMEDLFLLVTMKDKKDWPEQKADVISTMKVVRSEDRLSA